MKWEEITVSVSKEKAGVLNWKIRLTDGCTYTGIADYVTHAENRATEWAFDESTPDLEQIYSDQDMDEIHDIISESTNMVWEDILNGVIKPSVTRYSRPDRREIIQPISKQN